MEKVQIFNLHTATTCYKVDESEKQIFEQDLLSKGGESPLSLSNKLVYITPKLKIKSTKVKDYLQQIKSKAVRDSEKADVVVLSDDYLESIKHNNWYYSLIPGTKDENVTKLKLFKDEIINKNNFELSLKDYYTFFSKYFPHGLSSYMYKYQGHTCVINEKFLKDLESFINSLENNNENNLFFSSNYSYNSFSAFRYMIQSYLFTNYHRLDNLVTEEGYNTINKLIAQREKGKIIISESNFKSLMFDEYDSGLTLDAEMFENLSTFFKSDDKSFHEIAVETISNCNYQESFVYLIYLLFNYREKIRNTKASNSVNFKTLLNYFRLSKSQYSYIDYNSDYVLYKLSEANKLTPENLKLYLNLILAKINKGNSKFIEIQSVKIKGLNDENIEVTLNPECTSLNFKEE